MTPEELQYLQDRDQARTRSKALVGLDGDADQAAAAVELEKKTGVPSERIYGNFENFTNDYRSMLTQRMLDRNPNLARYLDAHPMAAVVSKNDWNRMADFYDKLENYKFQLPGSRQSVAAMHGFLTGMWNAITGAPLGQWMEKQKEEQPETKAWMEAHPRLVTAAKYYAAPTEIAFRALSGLFTQGPYEAAYGAAIASGLSETEAGMWGRRLGAAGEYFGSEMVGTGFHGPTIEAGRLFAASKALGIPAKELTKAISAGERYIAANETPPLGTHPLWDALHGENTKQVMSIYDALVDATDKTETRASSPELMKIATELVEKGNIFIHWDRIKQLYGDKLPEPGDKLLGDIPGFAEAYKTAVETQTNVPIKLSEWLSKVDDETRKSLHDDVRHDPNGLSLKDVEGVPTLEQALTEMGKTEAATPEPPPTPEVPPEQLAIDRMNTLRTELQERLRTHGTVESTMSKDGNLLQSLLAVSGQGALRPGEVLKAIRWAEIHNRPDIVERGIELAKYSNDPALEAQLRTESMNLRKLRAAQEAVNREMAQEAPLGWRSAETGNNYPVWSELLRDPNWKKVGEVTAMRVHGDMTAEEVLIRNAIATLFAQMAGPEAGAKLQFGRELRMGLETPYPVTASYVMGGVKYGAKDPTISILLGALNPIGSLGHEMIHHLRRFRFLTEKEWAVLEKRSNAEWREKHNIESRYEKAPEELKVEEGVAEGMKEWLTHRIADSPEVQTIFQKIADFFDKVRVMLKEFFGKDLTPEEIFEKIYRGEVGRREPEGAPMYGAKPMREAAQVPEIEVPKIMEPEPLGLLGLLPKGRELRYFNLIDRINAKQVQKLFGEAYKDEAKRQTTDWKRNFAIQFEQSLSNLKNRPDFRAAALFRNGILGSEKLDFQPKLDPTKLTPEQVAKLPTRWFNKTSGFDPNDLAGSLGFKTGSEMVDSIIRLEENRGRQKPENFVDRLAYHETERRMEMQFGKLDENILKEAREHAIGLERFDLLHEETLLLAAKAGQAMPFSKEYFRDQAKLSFLPQQQAQVSVIRYTREIGKSTKIVEDAFLKGDYLAAYVERQRTLRLMAEAELAKNLEKERGQFNKRTDRYLKRIVEGRPPEFTNWVHHIMFRIDKPPRRSVQDLQANIDAHPEKTLEAFSARHSVDGLPHALDEYGVEYNSSLPIADFLMETDQQGQPTWGKSIDNMSVAEYQKVHQSIIALDTVGRRTYQFVQAGKAVTFNEAIDAMTTQLKTLGEAWVPPAGEKTNIQRTRMFLQNMRAGLLQMEFIWDRIDKGRRGLFTKTFTDRFAEAGDEYRLLTRDYSRMLKRLVIFNKGVDLKEMIPHDIFFDPLKGLPKEGKPPEAGMILLNKGTLSRQSFRIILANVGNPSNLDKMARGYGTTPEKIMEWVNKHATEKDWGWASSMGKILEDMQDKADVMTMNMTGVKMERLPLGTVQTAFGEIPGWYYPMKYDKFHGGGRRPEAAEMNPPPLVTLNTTRGWERKRTGYAGPIDMTLEGLTTDMGRRVRDIAFREVVSDMGKIFRDQRFRDAMTNHMGHSYTQLLMPYLEDIAGLRGPTAEATQAVDAFLSAAQRNLIHVFIGYKISTVLKHTPTAFVQSWGEVGTKYMARAVMDLFGTHKELMISNNKFIMEGGQVGNLDWKGSGTLQGRRAHWSEAFGTSMDAITGHMNVGERMAHYGSWMIAQSDLAASKILWLAKYNEVMDKLKPKDATELARYKIEDAHTEAAIQANQAVRRTHGDTVITSRPQFMRTPIMRNLTALYGFFNHIFNRYYRMSWQTAEMWKNPKGITPADVRQLAGAFFLNVVVPAYFEEWATAKATDDEHGLIYHTVHTLMHPVWSAVPGIREVMSAVSMGADPGFGILQGGMKAYTDMVRIGGKLQKKGEIAREDIGDVIAHLNNMVGVAMRLPFTDQLGKWEKYGFNFMNNIEPAPQTLREFKLMVGRGTVREPRRH